MSGIGAFDHLATCPGFALKRMSAVSRKTSTRKSFTDFPWIVRNRRLRPFGRLSRVLGALYKFVPLVQAQFCQTGYNFSYIVNWAAKAYFIISYNILEMLMIRLFAKLIGLISLALVAITAILDITRSIANSEMTLTPLGQEWFNFHLPSLNGFQVGIERHLGFPWLWENVVQNILLAPSWIVFAVLALIFLWLGRRKERRWRQRFGS